MHLVRRDEAANDLLDTSTDAQDTMNIVKERLHFLMHSSEDFTGESISKVSETLKRNYVTSICTIIAVQLYVI